MSIWENIMNLWRLMKIDNYLYEIMDDYKNADSLKEQEDIFRFFCSSIWSSENKRRVYTKTIKFSVKKDVLNTEIGQTFKTWSAVEYKGYKARTAETDWCSLIRQKINNLYTRYFDKEVILKQDYIYLLNTPKRLYYQWMEGTKINVEELTAIIPAAIHDAQKLKLAYQKQKLNLSWNDYKKLIEGFLQKAFQNCKLIDDYDTNTELTNMYDFINEDNFYIRYFCKSLEHYMLNYTKEYYGLKRGRNKKYKHCVVCGALILKTNNRIKYCTACKVKVNREKTRENLRKKRLFDLENS